MTRQRSRLKLSTFTLSILIVFASAACGSDDSSGDEDEGSASAPSTSPVDESGWDYVALGGSIASGAGSQYGESYVDYYKDLVEEDTGQQLSLTDLSIGEGGTTQAVLDLMAQPSTIEALENAEVVTMEIGGNDLIVGDEPYFAGECDGFDCYEEALGTFETNYEEIVTQIKDLAGDDAILRSVTFYNPLIDDEGDFGDAAFAKLAGRVTEEMNERTCTISEAAGWVCVDVYPAFNGEDGTESPYQKGLIAGDKTHPSEEGHQLIAELIQDSGYEPLD